MTTNDSRLGPTLAILATSLTLNVTDGHAAVFTSSNAVGGNVVARYESAADGTLTLANAFPTGGLGTGKNLGNQGAVILSDDHQWLLVVNAGSNDLTVFHVELDGLIMTDLEGSGGTMPVSVTIHDNLVYVLNGGGSGNISGFTLDDGELTPLPNSTRSLSGDAMPAPAQILFSPDGSLLVVTEKMTNLIDTYAIGADGLASQPNVQPSTGMTPFGFAFTSQGELIVSEAFGGGPDVSAVSSYSVDRSGDLDVISPSVPTTETAACWIVVTEDDAFAYTTNTGSGSITGYAVQLSGALSILDADGVRAVTGPGSMPTDMALSSSGLYLYTLNFATGEIDVFTVDTELGALTPLQTVGGLAMNATNATGLAAE